MYWYLIVFWSFGLFEIGLQYFLHKIGITFFMGMSSIVLLVGSLFFIKEYKVTLNKIEKNIIGILIAYLVYSLLGLIYTDEITEASYKVAKQTYWLILFFITFFMLRKYSVTKQYRFLYLIGTISFIVLISLTLYNFLSNYDFGLLLSSRWFGISVFKDRNVFVQILFYSLLFSTLFLLNNNKKYEVLKHMLFFMGIVFILLIGILTGSRRVFLYTLIIGIVFFIVFKSKRKYITIAFFTIFFIVLLKVDSNFFTAYQNEHSSIGRSLSIVMDNGHHSAGGREYRLETSKEVINEFNLLEVLIGQGTSAYKAYFHDYPHNFMISAIIEGGVIRLFILFYFIFIIFHFLLKLKNNLQEYEIFFISSTFLIYTFTRLISNEEFYDTRTLMILIISYLIIFNKAYYQGKINAKNNIYK